MTILGLKTTTFGSLIQIFQYDSLARPQRTYHLSQEARAGLSEFRIPREFGQKLFEFQKAAVKIAAHHINKVYILC